MKALQVTSIAEQVAAHLRDEILRGSLSGSIPGSKALATELGVNHKTVNAAVVQLEKEGILIPQGTGKPRRVVFPENSQPPALRVGILPFAQADSQIHYIVSLQHKLIEEGHNCTMMSTSLIDLNMDPKRVARLVKKTDADAWIVVAGSREVLEWFSKQSFPTFAMFGNLGDIPLPRARPEKGAAVVESTNRLIGLGHKRIVCLIRKENLTPGPRPILKKFLQQLEDNGIPSGRYNLPVWENTPEGLQQCLESLFQHTPPTALLIDEASIYYIVQQFLGKRGIMTPRDISLICYAPDPTFLWCNPKVSHIDYASSPWVRRAVEWSRNIAHGRDDRQQELTNCKFIEGGTIGPAPANP